MTLIWSTCPNQKQWEACQGLLTVQKALLHAKLLMISALYSSAEKSGDPDRLTLTTVFGWSEKTCRTLPERMERRHRTGSVLLTAISSVCVCVWVCVCTCVTYSQCVLSSAAGWSVESGEFAVLSSGPVSPETASLAPPAATLSQRHPDSRGHGGRV